MGLLGELRAHYVMGILISQVQYFSSSWRLTFSIGLLKRGLWSLVEQGLQRVVDAGTELGNPRPLVHGPCRRLSSELSHRRHGGLRAWWAAAGLSSGVQLSWGHVSDGLARARPGQEALSQVGSRSGSRATLGPADPRPPAAPAPRDSGARPVARESPWQRTPGSGLRRRRTA